MPSARDTDKGIGEGMSAVLPTELRLFHMSGCIARHPTRRRRCAHLCAIDDASPPTVHVELPPTPWFVARCSHPLSYGGVCVGRRVRCLRRGVVEHRARAGGLHEPIDQRDQRDLHPHPSGRQPVAPLLSYGPSVVRRRRDVTAGAPSSGSRVILCPLHHVTPADGAPRVAGTACFFPDHRLSNSASTTVGADPSTGFARSG